LEKYKLDSLHCDAPSIKGIHFDFTFCRWVDPLPLMSILLEIFHISHPASTSSLNTRITIALPNAPPVQVPGPYQLHPDRLFRYLKYEGFLESIKDLKDKNHKIELTDEKTIYSENEDKYTIASYKNSLFIPLQLMDLKLSYNSTSSIDGTIRLISEKLNKLINVGITHLSSVIEQHYHEGLYYSIRLSLQELIQNVAQHAYSNEHNISLPVVFYVRYRYGGQNKYIKRNKEAQDNFDECIIHENKRCPLLKDSILRTAHGCFELFVLDRGIGLIENYLRAENNSLTSTRSQASKLFSAQQKIYIKAFKEGVRGASKGGSQRGGLSLLNSLLAQGGNHFFRIAEKDLWTGFQPPISRESIKSREYFNRESSYSRIEQKSFQGLGYALRLFTGERTDIQHENVPLSWTGLSDTDNKSAFLRELSFSNTNSKNDFPIFEQQIVIDDRFESSQYEYDYFIKKVRAIFPQNQTNTDVVLWRVGKNYMKNDIPNKLVKAVASHCSAPTTLVLSDIEGYEAQTYVSALEQYRNNLGEDWIKNIRAIYFVTKNLQFETIAYYFQIIH